MLKEDNIDILLCQETWHDNKKRRLPKIQGYRSIGKRRKSENPAGGVAIYYKEHLNMIETKQENDIEDKIELILAKLKMKKEDITVGSIYIPPKLNLGEVKQLQNYTTPENPSKVLIGGDWNVYATKKQNGKKKTKKWTIISKWIKEEKMQICSPTGKTLKKMKKEAPDFFVSRNMKIQTKIVDTKLDTDHFGIDTMLDSDPEKKVKFVIKKGWKSKEINTIQYMTMLNSIRKKKPNFRNIQEHLTWIKTTIDESLKLSCPKKTLYWEKEKNGQPWWTDKLSELIKTRNHLRKGMYINPHPSTKKMMQELRKEIRKNIQEAKTKFWEEKNSTRSINEIHRIIKTMKSKKHGKGAKFLNSKGATIGEKKEENEKTVADELIKYFSSVGSKLQNRKETKPTARKIRRTEESILLMNSKIQKQEIEEMMKNMMPLKAPGEDGIQPFAIKEGWEETRDMLLELYNKIWIGGEYPSEWNEGIIIPFPKNQEEYPKPKDFRPITLLSVMGKGLEKIVLKRLQKLNRTFSVIPDSQWGFQAGKSTIENLIVLHRRAHDAVTRRKILGVAFMDISKAYDNVDRRILQKKLVDLGIEGNMIRYLISFINNRKAAVKYKTTTSEKYEINYGVVQGSALSPELFNMYTSPLTEDKKDTFAFADDILLMKEGKTFKEVEEKLQNEIENLNEEARSLNLRFSAEKTKIITFNNRRKKEEITIKLNEEKIEIVKDMKYLGIIFDEKLKFDKQIEKMISTARRSFGFFKNFTHKLYGDVGKKMLIIYKSHIRSLMEYGCQIWGGTTTSRLKKIESTQHWCLTRLLGIPRRAEMADVRKFCKILSMEERRNLTYAKYWRKKNLQMDAITQNDDNFGRRSTKEFYKKKSFDKKLRELEESYGVDLASTDARSVEKRMHQRAERTWQEKPRRNRHSKLFKIIEEIKKKTKPNEKKKIRRQEVTTNQAIFGFLPLNKLKFSLKKSKTDKCPFCPKTQEDTIHALFQCKKYEDLRMRHFATKEIKNMKSIARCLTGKRGEFQVWKMTKDLLKRRKTEITRREEQEEK